MLGRGVDVSYEAIRLWCLKIGADYARRLRQLDCTVRSLATFAPSEGQSMILPLCSINAFSGGSVHAIALFLVASLCFFNRGQETTFFGTQLNHSALVQLVETLRSHAKPVLVDLAIVLTKRRNDTDG
jgi:hypothetical protein